jgi:hypothetical protein
MQNQAHDRVDRDDAIRKEARETLDVNPAAPYETVPANWRYRRHDKVDEAEAARVLTIYRQERTAHPERAARKGRTWWQRFLFGPVRV